MRESLIATAELTLMELVGPRGERKAVKLRPHPGALESGYGFAETKAEFRLEWMSLGDAMINLEMRIKVKRKSGWPFPKARPFFVVTIWDPADKSWAPRYRSEILTRQNAVNITGGVITFQMVELNLGKSRIEADNRTIRLELFHGPKNDESHLIAFLNTDLRKLRATEVGSRLKLNLKTFPSGELVGNVHLHSSRITLSRQFFSLQVELGGEVSKPWVFLELLMTNESNLTTGNGKRLKPQYLVSAYSRDTRWEQIYRSEPLRHNWRGTSTMRYKTAKFSEAKLSKGDSNRQVSLSFYYESGEENGAVKIGYMITTLATLIDTPAGTPFALTTRTGESPGYVILKQGVKKTDYTLVEAYCVVGNPPPENAIPSQTLSGFTRLK